MSQINQMDIKDVGGTITGYEEHKPQVNHMYLCYGHVALDTCLSALSTKKRSVTIMNLDARVYPQITKIDGAIA